MSWKRFKDLMRYDQPVFWKVWLQYVIVGGIIILLGLFASPIWIVYKQLER